MYKVVIATGGTGGHIFPAQILGKELLDRGADVLFIGGGLKTNRYFKQDLPYREINSCSPYKGGWWKALWLIGSGVLQSFKILSSYKPEIIVGFGSFYTFPVLLAALIRQIPIILFEPNAIPGKVNRFFSRWSALSCVQFAGAKTLLKGRCVEVQVPTTEKRKVKKEEACDYFYLKPDQFTFLVFGGSQGAQAINSLFSEAVGGLKETSPPFQVIHICGKTESADYIREVYAKRGIGACVKAFEDKMEFAWSAADLAICRSGAATVAEQISYAIPALFIPFPYATDNHQAKNAYFVEEEIQGAKVCLEKDLTTEKLQKVLQEMSSPERLKTMQQALESFKTRSAKPFLSETIFNFLIR